MPPVGTADIPAGSAPATAAPAVEAPAPETDFSKDNFSEKDFQAYREAENRATLDGKSGKLPTRDKKPAETAAGSAPAKSKEKDKETPADTAAASAAASPQKPQGKDKEETEKRFKELSENYGNAKREIEELKRRLTPPAEPAKPPASQPAAEAQSKEKEPQIDDLDDKGQPKYKTLAEFMTASRKWDRDQVLKEVETRQTKAQQEHKKKEHLRVINEGWGKKCEAGRTKHADFDTVALNPDLPIKEGSVPDAFVLDSEHGAEILYYLGQHPDELAALNKLNPLRQAKALFEIESKVSAKPAPAKKPSAAPAPPHEVNGNGNVPPEEAEQALADDDFTAYKNAENRKALARAKGK